MVDLGSHGDGLGFAAFDRVLFRNVRRYGCNVWRYLTSNLT